MSMRLLFILLLSFASSAAFADTFTLYFYPSPYGISWRTPGALARTVVLNQLSTETRKIGHASVQIQCGTPGSAQYQNIHAGMVEDDNNPSYSDMLFKQGYGMGILYYDFKGYLEQDKDLLHELDNRYREGNLSFLEIEISPSTCSRMVQYWKEYQQLGLEKRYGLRNRPLYKEGAGCTAFGTSFLEIAGLLEPEYINNWRQSFLIPERLFGGPDTQRFVPFKKVFFLLARNRWAKPDEPNYPITFWDPDRMYRWAKRTWKHERHHPTGKYELLLRGNARGLRIDRSSVPTPTGSFWKI